jgi:hypothetical protein
MSHLIAISVGMQLAWAAFSRFQAGATVRLRTADFDSEQAGGAPLAALQA